MDDRRKNMSLRENNPGFKLCMHCGGDLPPSEDGQPKWRKYPEPCEECVAKGLNRYVDPEDGKVKDMPGGYGVKWIEETNRIKNEKMNARMV